MSAPIAVAVDVSGLATCAAVIPVVDLDDAEVRQNGVAVVVEKNVRRLYVAMHHSFRVQRLVLDAPYLACRAASEKRDNAEAAERFAGMQKIALRGRGLAQGVVRGEIAVDVSFHPASLP